jgi:hypothetical protein
MKIYKLFIVTAIVVFTFSALVSAQNANLLKGSEKTLLTTGETNKNQCFAYQNYVVKTIRKEGSKTDSGDDNSGDDISIFKRDVSNSSQKSCQTAENSLLSVENTEGNSFRGIFKDYLFIEKNLYPDYSNLEIYNLKTNKIAFKTEYTEWDDYRINLSGGRFLNYSQWSKKSGLLKNCRDAKKWKRDGLGINWLQTKKLDLQTMKETSVGILRCTSVN